MARLTQVISIQQAACQRLRSDLEAGRGRERGWQRAYCVSSGLSGEKVLLCLRCCRCRCRCYALLSLIVSIILWTQKNHHRFKLIGALVVKSQASDPFGDATRANCSMHVRASLSRCAPTARTPTERVEADKDKLRSAKLRRRTWLNESKSKSKSKSENQNQN